jgi:hypothetical protein
MVFLCLTAASFHLLILILNKPFILCVVITEKSLRARMCIKTPFRESENTLFIVGN